MRLPVYILLLIALVGCRVERFPVISQDTLVIEKEVVRDSIISLPPDSSVIRAWFECDSLNHVVMTELEAQAGEKVKPYTSFNKGQLTMTAKVDSQSIYLSWKERLEEKQITKTVIKEVPVEKVVYKKPKWLLALATIGTGAILGIVGLIIKKFK